MKKLFAFILALGFIFSSATSMAALATSDPYTDFPAEFASIPFGR